MRSGGKMLHPRLPCAQAWGSCHAAMLLHGGMTEGVITNSPTKANDLHFTAYPLRPGFAGPPEGELPRRGNLPSGNPVTFLTRFRGFLLLSTGLLRAFGVLCDGSTRVGATLAVVPGPRHACRGGCRKGSPYAKNRCGPDTPGVTDD